MIMMKPRLVCPIVDLEWLTWYHAHRPPPPQAVETIKHALNQQVFGALSIMALIHNCLIILVLPGDDSLTNHP